MVCGSVRVSMVSRIMVHGYGYCWLACTLIPSCL